MHYKCCNSAEPELNYPLKAPCFNLVWVLDVDYGPSQVLVDCIQTVPSVIFTSCKCVLSCPLLHFTFHAETF